MPTSEIKNELGILRTAAILHGTATRTIGGVSVELRNGKWYAGAFQSQSLDAVAAYIRSKTV